MRLILIISIITTLALVSYAHYRLDRLRADNDALYQQVQVMEAKFIRNKSMMQEGKWRAQ